MPEELRYFREVVERSLRSVLPPESLLPGDDEDWIESGLLDSMAHVEVLMHIERGAGTPDLFARTGADPPTSIRAAIAAIQKALQQSVAAGTMTSQTSREEGSDASPMAVFGWGSSLGSERVAIERVEQEFSLPVGKLSQGAGFEAVCRASAREGEVSLARAAAQQALKVASTSEDSLDWILATSETLVGVPSLGAALHSALLAPQTCGVLDVGGACAGVVNCLMVADALIAAGKADSILIASADVHSRILAPGKVPGEFGGLFGDGASAFVLRRAGDTTGDAHAAPYRMLTSLGSCVGTYASALELRPGAEGAIELQFDGEALAHAAVDRMAMILNDLETASGKHRDTASAFAIHQPNPRIVEIFLRRAKLPPEKVPAFTRTTGNLGSSTCGLALSTALEEHSRKPRSQRGPIFVAALGPGLLWAGAILE